MGSNRGRSRRRSAGARSRGENHAGMIAILIVVCLIFAVLLLEGWRLRGRIHDNEARGTELQAAIEEETARTAQIESRREYMQSDEYIRQAAKDRLGLVESGEIIFKSRDKD